MTFEGTTLKYQAQKYGLKQAMIREEVKNLFFKFVDKTSSDKGCWLWTGSLGGPPSSIYGSYRFQRYTIRAHRFSYIAFVGDFDRELDVCHRCDIKICVNPEHLFLGTARDNLRDAVKKDRYKIKRATVAEIKRIYSEGGITTRQLAAQFNISKSRVHQLIHNINRLDQTLL